ncbi:MAG: hypothetical protein ACT4R6_03200 [Gemmatimonadaceae bacterium]
MPGIRPISSAASASARPPALHDRAIDNLRYIREAMERAEAVTAISGWGIAAAGGVAFVATAATLQIPLNGRWIATWIIAAAVAFAAALGATVRKARQANLPLLNGAMRRLALAFAPAMFVAGVLTAALVLAGLTAWLAPVWLLLYGAGVTAAGMFSVRVIPVMGACFVALGSIALLVPGYDTWTMATGFGGLHMLFGLFIARKYNG